MDLVLDDREVLAWDALTVLDTWHRAFYPKPLPYRLAAQIVKVWLTEGDQVQFALAKKGGIQKVRCHKKDERERVVTVFDDKGNVDSKKTFQINNLIRQVTNNKWV